ncbi:MAG TPA: hypothetical protein VH834_05235 [Solirubrobacteraceae bacterium]|jgi:hypothetical protein
MSVAPSVALPHAPAVKSARSVGSGRLALLFAVILTTSLSAFALAFVSFVKPIGEGDGLPDYAAIAPHRDYVWAFFAIAGVQLIVGACAAALAAWLLVPDRGARWATVGGGLVWLGAALYGVGIGGWAAVYYFATDHATLGSATAGRFVDHVNDDTAHLLAMPIGGAVLIALGSLTIAVALWRARTVPRWVPVVGAISAVATVVLPPDGVAGLVGEAASSASTIAVGWYAWQRGRAAFSA